MNKKLIISLSILAFGLFNVKSAKAEEICTQSYGQPVVCGVKTPSDEHIVIEAGLKENLQLIGLTMIAFGGAVYVLSNSKAFLN